MKITQVALKFKLEDVLDVTCDVHKKLLHFFARLPGIEFSDECTNTTREIRRMLNSFLTLARKHGKKSIRVVCEPTGEYDRVLLRTAHRMGFRTSYVNTENVKKYRHIEANDDNKNDTKDPKVISSLPEL